MKDPLLSGPESVRDPKERRALFWCIVALPLSLGLVGLVLSTVLQPSHLVLIGIGALVYVSIARGRLLGDSIHVHSNQLPELAGLVHECARLLDIPPPQIFIRDDVVVPIVAVGVGEPYALVISSHWLSHLQTDELRFLIGRELGHIRAGHTRISSILSVNGRENVAVSLVFGAFLRRTEYTADRLGLFCCGAIDAATSAIAIASFHRVARDIDVGRVAEQLHEIDADPTLRAGEWLASAPYATRRIAVLKAFSLAPLATSWMARFAAAQTDGKAAREVPRPRLDLDSRRGFAGGWRRFGAWLIDMAVILAIAPGFVHAQNAKEILTYLPDLFAHIPLVAGSLGWVALFFLWLYAIVLVSATGRTIGMMVFDLCVVRSNLERPTLWNVIARYMLAALSILTVFPIVLWGLRRVQPYDRYSGTRLVSASALLTVPSA